MCGRDPPNHIHTTEGVIAQLYKSKTLPLIIWQVVQDLGGLIIRRRSSQKTPDGIESFYFIPKIKDLKRIKNMAMKSIVLARLSIIKNHPIFMLRPWITSTHCFPIPLANDAFMCDSHVLVGCYEGESLLSLIPPQQAQLYFECVEDGTSCPDLSLFKLFFSARVSTGYVFVIIPPPFLCVAVACSSGGRCVCAEWT